MLLVISVMWNDSHLGLSMQEDGHVTSLLFSVVYMEDAGWYL